MIGALRSVCWGAVLAACACSDAHPNEASAGTGGAAGAVGAGLAAGAGARPDSGINAGTGGATLTRAGADAGPGADTGMGPSSGAQAGAVMDAGGQADAGVQVDASAAVGTDASASPGFDAAACTDVGEGGAAVECEVVQLCSTDAGYELWLRGSFYIGALWWNALVCGRSFMESGYPDGGSGSGFIIAFAIAAEELDTLQSGMPISAYYGTNPEPAGIAAGVSCGTLDKTRIEPCE